MIFVYPHSSTLGKSYGEVVGDSYTMNISTDRGLRTLGHELGHLIGYEHPHHLDPRYPIPGYANDIMVQDNGEGSGQGTDSHPKYMLGIMRWANGENNSNILLDFHQLEK